MLVCILGTHEFFQLAKKTNAKPQTYFGIVAGCVLFATCYIAASTSIYYPLFLNIPLFFLIFIFELYKKSEAPFLNIAFTLLGIFYIALPLGLLNFLAFPLINQSLQYDSQILLGFIFMVWAHDTGAYIVGSLWGKHRLFERISPKKSWEGSAGGVIATFGIAWLVSGFYHLLNLQQWMGVGVIVVLAGTYGDLAKSMLKRSIGVKDSGKILPGHGGIIDRFDAILFSAPFLVSFLLYLYIFKV